MISSLARHPHGRVAQCWRAVGNATAVNVIVAGEARFGIVKAGPVRLSRRIEEVLAQIRLLPLGDGVVAVYASVRAELERRGRIIGSNDLWIAAHALSLDLVVVTDNVGEFGRVPDLKVENWLR